MTPKPVRRDPGSKPRIRTLATDTVRVWADRWAEGTPAGARSAEALPATVPRLRRPPVRALTSRARQDLVRYLAICVNVLYVVQVFEGFDQMQHCDRRLPLEGHRNRSALGHLLSADGDESRGLQRHAHSL